MSYLFYIDKQAKKVLHPHAIKLCPELGVLSEQETLCIIMAYDYHSPYNQFPEEERQRKAEAYVWGTSAPAKLWEKEKMKLAADAYKSLQWNPKIELIRVYQKKIEDLNDDLSRTLKDTTITEVVKTTKELRKYIQELEDEVISDEIEESHLTGNKELSWLEKMQANKEYYERVVKPRNEKDERKRKEAARIVGGRGGEATKH